MKNTESLNPSRDDFPQLSNSQAAAAIGIIRNRISILCGGPGTGKTFTIAAICEYLSSRIGAGRIAVGTPTGKAAVRVRQALEAASLRRIACRTWHSRLRLFGDEAEPEEIDATIAIGDESSMIPTEMMAHILRASRTCNVLLVGDTNQLAPIGHGKPMADMIAGGVPSFELTEIRRNSGQIVETCHAIRQERAWNPCRHDEVDLKSGHNLSLVKTSSADDSLSEIVEEVSLRDRWECQVIVPLNTIGKLSRQVLNKKLQDIMNPHGESIAGTDLRIGDKVVNISNNKFQNAGENRHDVREYYVANGEQGEIVSQDKNCFIVRIVDGGSEQRLISVFKKKKVPGQDSDQSGTTWELAYAISCHKAQGSEWPTAIVVVDDHPSARTICDRSWIYTAISRAKRHCILVGRKEVADQMCRIRTIDKRRTFLGQMIQSKG